MLQSFLERLNRLEVVTSSSLGELLELLCREEKEIEASVYREFLDVLNGHPTNEQLSSIADALSVMISNNEDNSSIAALHASLLDYQKEMQQMIRLERDIESKAFDLNLREQKDHVQSMTDQGCFSDAAWGLISTEKIVHDRRTALEEQLLEVPEADAELIESVRSLDQEMKKANINLSGMNGFLCQMLIEFFDDRFRVDAVGQSVDVRRSVDGHLFSEVWKAAEILERTSILLPRLGERIAELIDAFILNDDIHTTRLSVEIEKETDRSTLKLKEDACQNRIDAVGSRLAALLQLLEFLCDVLLCSTHSLCLGLGNELWSSLHPALASKVLNVEDALEGNEKLLYLEAAFKNALDLEDGLRRIGFLQEGTSDFSSAVCIASKAAFHKYSEHYIRDARDVMTTPIWDTLIVGHDPVLDPKSDPRHDGPSSSQSASSPGLDLLRSPLGRGRYQITETASRIQQIVEAMASEGCSKGTLVMQALMQCIGDICFMFACIFPILHSKELEVPQLGLLTANDCFYLSDEMLLLPITVPNFRSVAPDVEFLSEAKRLNQAGRCILENQVQLQSNVFREVLNGVDDFGYLRTGQQGIALRKATNQIVRMANQLGRILKDVVSVSDRCIMAASVAEGIAGPILSKLMSRTDISSQESHELPILVQELIAEISPALLSIPKEICSRDVDVGRGGSNEEAMLMDRLLYGTFSRRCLKLKKLRRLLRVWDARLNQIVEWWMNGELMDDGFSMEEIRSLIWALFEHSEKREDAVAIVTGTV